MTPLSRPIHMTQCLQCKSRRVTSGSIVDYESAQPAHFRPHGLRFFTLTLTQGPQLAKEGFACLECGLVWSSTSAEKLVTFIRKHCDNPDIPSA